jgi:type VII secretion-associated serine protease mycosin
VRKIAVAVALAASLLALGAAPAEAVRAGAVRAGAVRAQPPRAASAGDCLGASSDAYRDTPWPQRLMAPDQVWMLSRGAGVTVAVLDTGVSSAAPALAGKVLTGVDLAAGRKAANEDCDGHGTFVASLIVAGRVDDSGLRGMAPDSRVLPIRVVDSFQDVQPDTLARGIDEASARGAKVIAVLPSAPFSSAGLAAAVRRAQGRGCLVVATAGTERNKDGDVAYPAALPGVLAVNAVGADGTPAELRAGDRAAVAAPGGDIVGVAPSGRGNRVASSRAFATAFAAGAAALVRAYRPDLSPDQVTARLLATADPARGGAAVGSGTLNPVAAVTTVMPMRIERPAEPPEQPLSISVPVVAKDPPGGVALMAIAVAAGFAAAVGVIADSIARARRRRLAPAHPPAPGPAPDRSLEGTRRA